MLSNLDAIKKKYTDRVLKWSVSSGEMINDIDYLIDVVESQQQEIESLKNWNACEEEDYKRLIESDKQRIRLEQEIEQKDEALRQAREAMIKSYDEIDKYNQPKGACGQMCPQTTEGQESIIEALSAIDKALGGNKNE